MGYHHAPAVGEGRHTRSANSPLVNNANMNLQHKKLLIVIIAIVIPDSSDPVIRASGLGTEVQINLIIFFGP